MYECDCWKIYKTDIIVTQHLRESFPFKVPLREEKLLENIKSGSPFGYIQCDIEVPDNLRQAFTNFPTNFTINNDIRLRKTMYRKKDFWLNSGEC